MFGIVAGVVMLVAFVAVVVWLLSQPEDDEVRELPGLIAGNWWWIDR